MSAWTVTFIGPLIPDAFTRGRNQFCGNSEPSSGSMMQGPVPEGAVQKFVDTPGSTIGSVGKSVHLPPGPLHGWTVMRPPEPVFTPPPPPPPLGARGLDPRATEPSHHQEERANPGRNPG